MRHQALLDRRDAIRASNEAFAEEAFAAYRSDDGFQDTRWGMSPEDVKALYPKAWMTSPQGDLRVTTQVAERSATLGFVFVQDKLAAVSVGFDLAASLRDEFNALSRALGAKYGEPELNKDTAAAAADRLWWIEARNRSTESTARLRESSRQRGVRDPRANRDPVDAQDRAWEEEARLDEFQARFDFALEQGWKTGETELRLSGQQAPGSKRLSLVYVSRFLKSHLEETLAEKGTQRILEQSRDL